MTLTQKIFVLLLAGTALFSGVGFAFHHYLILPSFIALEREEARKDMRRCVEALEAQIERIDLLCFDWAAWDDTYEFIVDPGEDYRESNLIPESFVDNGLNFIYLFRRDATLVWGAYYDLDRGVPIPFPPFDERAWSPEDPLLQHAGRPDKVMGIVSSDWGPLLIASRPILPSEATAGETVRGTLIMGRLLDEGIVARIRDQTQVDVEVIDLENAGLPAGAHRLGTGEVRLVEENPETLRVLAHAHDIHGRDALVLQITGTRTILARGRAAIRLDSLAVAIAGVLFVILLLVSLRQVVIMPLARLSAHVKGVGFARGMEPIPFPARRDEIGEVAREFNSMLERLRREEVELVAAEAALRAGEARIKAILDTAPDAILTIDRENRIESANRAASSLFGYTVDEFPGMAAADLIAGAERPAWEAALAAVRAAPGDRTPHSEGESGGLRKDGTAFPVHLTLSALPINGEALLICAIRDTSGWKAMREKVARNQHLARIGEMGASVAHEIRNPLAGIRGALQVISASGFGEAERQEVAHSIQELVDRIDHTVEQLLHYSRPLFPRHERFALRAMLEAVSADPPEGVRTSIACPPDLTLEADPRLFRHVLENIWRNACQATPRGGAIHWEAARERGGIALRLWNDGEGIPPGDLAQVFDPFFTTRVDGTGLGLAISLRIVEAHGGTISIENPREGGVLVVIRMPMGE